VLLDAEPCPMCAAGMVWAALGRIVFAAAEPDFAPLLTGGPRFRLRCAEVVSADKAVSTFVQTLSAARIQARESKESAVG
jgi:tRNA(Arg) A34 adenosine deaminase TadA